jgi:hypothetical protein
LAKAKDGRITAYKRKDFDMGRILLAIIAFSAASVFAEKQDPRRFTLNVMAPLKVGAEYGVDWDEFENLLVVAKREWCYLCVDGHI